MSKTIAEQRTENEQLIRWERQGATVTRYYVGQYNGEEIYVHEVRFEFEEDYRPDQTEFYADITWSPLVKMYDGGLSWSSGPGAFKDVTTEMIADSMTLIMKRAVEISKSYSE